MSIASSSSSANKDQHDSKVPNSKLDLLFPVYDHLMQFGHLPKWIPTICSIYTFFQLMFTSTWTNDNFYRGNDLIETSANKYARIGGKIAWWSVYGTTYEEYMIIFAFLLTFAVVSVAFIVLTVVNYYQTRKFIRWTLYPVNFIFRCASQIMMHPIGYLIGIGIEHNLMEHNTNLVVVVIFSCLIYLVNSLIYFIGVAFSSKSVYLLVTPSSAWDYAPMFIIMITSSLSPALLVIATMYAEWCETFVQIVHLGIVVYVYYRFYYHPFHFQFFNSVMMSIALGSMASDLFFIATTRSTYNAPDFVPLVLYYLIFFVSLPINYLLLARHKNQVFNDLAFNDSDDDNNLDQLDIYKNLFKAEFYLRTGFSMMADRFLDWSFIKYMHRTMPETSYTIIKLVAFFPSEWRTLNVIYRACNQSGRISYLNRYLLFEVSKLLNLRQCSASSQALEKIYTLRMQTVQIENIIRSMWKARHFSLRQFENYAKLCHDIDAIYDESMTNFPNNAKLCEEYAIFLAECKTEYIKAVHITSRAAKIEEGHNYIKDICFKLMVKYFPCYLKSKILDYRGNFIKRVRKSNGSSTNSEENNIIHSSNTEGNAFSLDIEEQISKQLLTSGKQRIALDRALKKRELNHRTFMKNFALVSLVINIIIFVALYLYFTEAFIVRKNSTDGIVKMSKVRFYAGLAMISAQLRFANESGRIPNQNVLKGFDKIDGSRMTYFDKTIPNQQSIVSYVMDSRNYMEDVIDLISDLGEDGMNIKVIAGKIIQRESYLYKCVNGLSHKGDKRSIISTIDFLYVSLAFLAADQGNPESWYTSDHFCDSSLNYIHGVNDMKELLESLDKYQKIYREDLSFKLFIISIVVSICTFLLNDIPIIISVVRFIKLVKRVQNIILSCDRTTKERAGRKIMKSEDFDDHGDVLEASNEKNAKISILSLITIIASVLGICLALTIFGDTRKADEVNYKIQNLDYWINFVVSRIFYTAESLFATLDVIMLNGSFNKSWVTQQERIEQAVQYAEKARMYNRLLLDGNDEVGSIIGFDDQFDGYNMRISCVPSGTGRFLVHSQYLCGSLTTNVELFNEFVMQIVQDPNSFHGQLSNDLTLNLMHMSTVHLWYFMWDGADRITSVVSLEYDKLCDSAMMFMVIGLIISFVFLLANLAIIHYMKNISDTIFILIKRIQPIDLINNRDLLNFILNEKNNETNKAMNLSQSVLYQLVDGLIMSSLNGTIETVNPAITSILGFKPEQLLGQNTGSLFAQEDLNKVEHMMTMMAKKEHGPIYEDHLICLDDSGFEVQCHISILMIMYPNTENPHSFIMQIRDESELVKKQYEAEVSKEKSERLLYQIMPRDIVIKLNSGEKEISFTVPSASIIFIDIQRFSDYCSGMTPSDIMMHLSTVFASFDQQAAKHSLITKIKLIGDVYMAASGLFLKENDQPSQHADQILKFALDCLLAIDDVNTRMNSSLQVRIGVNSGGPLIAGVLGVDKPVFDIIGDPINVAARLQTTDIVGKVHISQGTFELIQGMDFACEPRGEVYLKGKGRTNTYFVVPMTPYALSSASIGNLLLTGH